MFKKKYLILFITLTLYCCQTKKKEPSSRFSSRASITKKLSYIDNTEKDLEKIIIPSDLENIIDFSKVVDSIYYVALETNKNSLIGKIDRVVVYNNLIYVQDLNISKTVFIFSKQGKFIKKLSNYGGGPGEYLKPEFFYIDADNKTLEITDNDLHKIFTYDLNGNFIKERLIPFRLNKYSKLASGDYLIDANNRLNEQWSEIQNHRVFISDSLFNLKKIGLAYNYSNSKKTKFKSPEQFLYNNKNLLYIEPFNDSIFELTKNKVYARYVLDFRNFNKTKPLVEFESLKTFFKEYANNDDYALFLGLFLKTEKNIYINLLHQARDAYIFYNTENKKMISGMSIDMTKIRNGIFFTPPVSSTKSDYISVLNSEKIYNIYSEWQKNVDILKYRDKSIIKFVSTIKLGDNPVLMFTKIKNF